MLDDANYNRVLSSLTITDVGTMKMNYSAPVSSAVHLVFTAQSITVGGSITIDPSPAVMGYYTTTYQQQNVTTTICDHDNDKYRFGFNGKEKVNEWAGVGNYLDFGARGLDSRIGRWLSVDLLAKKMPMYSSYTYCGDNPVTRIDPTGNYFFGLFGSTSAQRNAARELAARENGFVRNITKRYISADYDGTWNNLRTEKGDITVRPAPFVQYFYKDGSYAPTKLISADEANEGVQPARLPSGNKD